MDCWEVLGIEPRSDKKTIKIAYAKLLKKTRPDEDPEGFQRLHSAYKEAQSWEDYYYEEDESEWDSTKSASEPAVLSVDNSESPNDVTLASPSADYVFSEDVKPLEVTVTYSESMDNDSVTETIESTLPSVDLIEEPVQQLSKEDLQLLDDIREQEDALAESWESFREQVNTLVADHKACNVVANWSFLEEMPAMQDLEFRKNVADSLFEVVSELNEESLKKKSLYIKRPVINHLNNLFKWDKHWQEYEYRYSASLHEAVFPYLEETEKVVPGSYISREVHYYRRIAAFAIDVAIFAVIGFLLFTIGNNLTSTEDGVLWLIGWGFIYQLVLTPIQECSHHQATIGKRIMNLQVIDMKGKRLGFFHALGRSFTTIICCSLFKFVLWINLILSWWKNELLQDRLSRSYIVLNARKD
ncbi:RDD family protein [Leucothrix arctica]|uniref:J domain-containing protein n=1 Tax=Leucothrix arctica TaxID=1481894 RepID=A0A317C601_9GAMM|nr:RDD family protein [Leucothrix arctica]PWQ93689.1 hypothetical protein DKT75_18935 [Leucothrix arctica]